MTDTEAIRKRHARTFGDTMEPDFEADDPLTSMRQTQFCSVCDGPWLCDTATVLAGADALLDALDHIRYLSLDVPMALNSGESFYRSQTMEAIGTAQRAVDAHRGSKP